MSRKTGKHSGTTLVNRKTPLPELSFQDIKVVFANSPANHPATTVVMSIPYCYDLLSPQGIRDWNAQRASSIEQENVTTIQKDSFYKPVTFKTVIEPVSEFNNIDEKVREIKQYANIIEQDLDELGIPQLTEQPHVEPLFKEYSRHEKRVRIYDDTDEQAESQSNASTRTIKQFSKKKISSSIIDSTERAREKVKIAERSLDSTVKSGFSKRKKSDDMKSRPIANEERGKYNWGRINQLMQEDTF